MAFVTMTEIVQPLSRRILPILVGSLLIVSGCDGARPGDGPFEIALFVSPTPPTTESGALLITVTDSLGSNVTGATVVVRAESAGMPPLAVTAVEGSPGRYGVQAFIFPVSGDWTVSAEISTAEGVRGRRSFPVHVVQEPS